MDPKKQALNPELKQIYERVMNTQIKPQPGAPTPTTNIPPTAQNAATPPIPNPAAATTENKPPIITTPPIPNPPAAAPTTPTAANAAPAMGTNPAIPPQPLSNTNNGFVFSGNKMKSAQPGTPAPTAGKLGAKKIPMPAIMAGIVVLIVVWGVVWALVLGLI